MKKNIVIVGGSGLLGFSIANFLSSSSQNIIIVDKKPIKNIKKNNIYFIKCDVTKDEEIDFLISKLKKEFHKIDAAIYSAYPKSRKWGTSFENLKRRYLNEDLQAQLGSAIIFSQKIIKHFLKQKHGNLIHLASIQGVTSPKFNHYEGTNMVSPIEYSVMKSGIISLTKYLAKFYKKENIRVNCISPGGIFDNQDKRFLKKYKADCGSKGILDTDDINGTIEFLLSDGSNYITGQNIIVDDGWSL